MSDLSAQMDQEFMECWKKLVEVSPAPRIVRSIEERRPVTRLRAKAPDVEEVADGAHS